MGSDSERSMIRSQLGRPPAGARCSMAAKPGWRRMFPVHTMRVDTPRADRNSWAWVRSNPASGPISKQKRIQVVSVSGVVRPEVTPGRSAMKSSRRRQLARRRALKPSSLSSCTSP